MEEKEELLKNIARSREIMRAIENKENEKGVYQTAYVKRKKKCGPAALVVILVILAPFSFSLNYSVSYVFGWLWPIFSVGIWLLIRMSLKQITSNISRIDNELDTMKQNSLLAWLPLVYRDSISYKYITEYLVNMRANTLKDAINLFETEMHQARVELIASIR